MAVDRRGRLDLASGEALVVRLVSGGRLPSAEEMIALHALGTRPSWIVGDVLAFHYLHTLKRSVRCSLLGCPGCQRGLRRDVRFKTQLLLETPSGLEEHTAFLSVREHAQFAKAATVLVAQGRDPTDQRLLWRFKPGTSRTVEVLFL